MQMFAPMKGLVFVGGYKPDKTVFSVVTEDEHKARTCHLYRWTGPVPIQS